MKLIDYIRESLRSNIDLANHIDTHAAELNIRSNVYFRGPTILILAFSIVIASVGLNVNSTAVIIGAMLISPLMGPIIGIGLAGSINDVKLFRDSAWNLLVMVGISLAASALYFLLSPLELANPTELEARTSPSIFDVMIALFGGAAGIVEMSRKEKGTVLSGVAIATALMPPLCTAGYGLANWNGHFFFGAMGLFGINTLFIALATYAGAKLMHFREVEFISEKRAKRTRRVISSFTLVVVALSLWSAVSMIRRNNFEISAENFISENRSLDRAYIYDYKIDGSARTVDIRITGRQISDEAKEALIGSALSHGITRDELIIHENSLEETDNEKMVNLFERSEAEIALRDAKIMMLRDQVDSLKGESFPSVQITRELQSQYPDVIEEIYLSKGTVVQAGTLGAQPRTTIIIRTKKTLSQNDRKRMEEWLKIRLDDEQLELLVLRQFNTSADISSMLE